MTWERDRKLVEEVDWKVVRFLLKLREIHAKKNLFPGRLHYIHACCDCGRPVFGRSRPFSPIEHLVRGTNIAIDPTPKKCKACQSGAPPYRGGVSVKDVKKLADLIDEGHISIATTESD